MLKGMIDVEGINRYKKELRSFYMGTLLVLYGNKITSTRINSQLKYLNIFKNTYIN
jgi:hypothetical protein